MHKAYAFAYAPPLNCLLISFSSSTTCKINEL